MSDLIRSMMGMRRSPVGMGNNPSPFPIDVPQEPEMPDFTSQIQDIMMDQRRGSGLEELKQYYDREKMQDRQGKASPNGMFQSPMMGGYPRMGQ
jgi:hypothetical protein